MVHPLFGVGGPVIVSGPSTFSSHKSMEIPTKSWSKEMVLFNIAGAILRILLRLQLQPQCLIVQPQCLLCILNM